MQQVTMNVYIYSSATAPSLPFRSRDQHLTQKEEYYAKIYQKAPKRMPIMTDIAPLSLPNRPIIFFHHWYTYSKRKLPNRNFQIDIQKKNITDPDYKRPVYTQWEEKDEKKESKT